MTFSLFFILSSISLIFCPIGCNTVPNKNSKESTEWLESTESPLIGLKPSAQSFKMKNKLNDDNSEDIIGRAMPKIKLSEKGVYGPNGEPNDEQDLEEPEDLCLNPTIHSVDSMTNGSVWLYRDNFYWQLTGLPDNKPVLEGPFLIWWRGMAPVKPMIHVMTSNAGESKGTTFRFKLNQFWAYNSRGQLFIGSLSYGKPISVPYGGLTAVLFNGNKSDPLMIGFRGVNVYYYKFSAMKWKINGRLDGYVQGRYGENFPGDLDMAFALPATDEDDGYVAYLFKNGKYCKRAQRLKSGNTCDEWKDIRELYGCPSPTLMEENTVESVDNTTEIIRDDGIDVWPPDPEVKAMHFADSVLSQTFAIKSHKTFLLVSILIYLKLN